MEVKARGAPIQHPNIANEHPVSQIILDLAEELLY